MKSLKLNSDMMERLTVAELNDKMFQYDLHIEGNGDGTITLSQNMMVVVR